jgi:hypothetical protein
VTKFTFLGDIPFSWSSALIRRVPMLLVPVDPDLLADRDVLFLRLVCRGKGYAAWRAGAAD